MQIIQMCPHIQFITRENSSADSHTNELRIINEKTFEFNSRRKSISHVLPSTIEPYSVIIAAISTATFFNMNYEKAVSKGSVIIEGSQHCQKNEC